MDPDLLGNLLDQHSSSLELYARQWCDSPEDVVQEAFLKLAGLPAARERFCLALPCGSQWGDRCRPRLPAANAS